MNWHARMFLILIISALSAIVASGLDWGLPSRLADTYLFASHHVWSGEELARFDPNRMNDSIGADVDRNPADTSESRIINSNDQERAEIIRRYRLFSAQPDEMITFMSLQQMKPGEWDFDPRLYQYGGLWIYPVGAMLKAAAMVGLIDLRPDSSYYYENPEAFGRFYIVARVYTLIGYAVLLAASAAIIKRLTGNDYAAISAAGLVGVCPVVFAMAHEAKPHLWGAALMLITCICASRYVETGRRRDSAITGMVCGLACGMVLSAAVVGIVLPLMIVLRRDIYSRRLAVFAIAAVCCIITYTATNPYVPINLIGDHSAFVSNFENTRAMYAMGTILGGLRDGFPRLVEAASIPVLILLGCAILAVVLRRKAFTSITLLMTIPAAIVLVQFFLLAEGKPSEYARFIIFPVVLFALAGVWIISLIHRRSISGSLMIIAPVVVVVIATMPYVVAFNLDARDQGTRAMAAAELADLVRHDKILNIRAVPAPYCLPPVDLWRWQLQLDRSHESGHGDVSIGVYDNASQLKPVDSAVTRILIDSDQRSAPITWANKPFEILIHGVK